MKTDFKTVGILGGLGPQATIDLYQEIVNLTLAKIDQEHLPVIIYSLPQVPSRMDYLFREGESPLTAMIDAVKVLENAGAEYIAIACNTAHLFINEVGESLKNATIVNMIDETFNYIKSNYPEVKKIGLMATNGGLKANIYKTSLDLEIITPEDYFQNECLMPAIFSNYGIKAGNLEGKPRELLLKAGNNLVERGAEVIIFGCTEIPLVLNENDFKVPVVNPTMVLAKKLIQLSKGV